MLRYYNAPDAPAYHRGPAPVRRWQLLFELWLAMHLHTAHVAPAFVMKKVPKRNNKRRANGIGRVMKLEEALTEASTLAWLDSGSREDHWLIFCSSIVSSLRVWPRAIDSDSSPKTQARQNSFDSQKSTCLRDGS
jgi:hypothetical protein